MKNQCRSSTRLTVSTAPISKRLVTRNGPMPLAAHSIAVEQLECVVQPWPTPLFPAEALSLPSMRHVTPDLLLYPIFDVAEALTRVPNREVVHPSPEHWIDQAYHPLNRLRPVSAENFLELPQQRCPLFELGRVMRPHQDPWPEVCDKLN